MPETDAQRLARIHQLRQDWFGNDVASDDLDWLLAEAAQAHWLRGALEAACDMLGDVLMGNIYGGGPDNSEIDDAIITARRALEGDRPRMGPPAPIGVKP